MRVRFLLLGLQLLDLLLELLELVWGRGQLHAHAGRPFVNEIDRLVGEGPVADVAVAHNGRRPNRGVGDGDPVVLLVQRLDALQDVDRLQHGGLVDEDRLEAALEGGVLLDVLAVLVERSRPYALDLAARESRL